MVLVPSSRSEAIWGTRNYLTTAKQHHAEGDHSWTPALDLAGQRFAASTLRDIGPPRQSEPLNYEAVLLLDLPQRTPLVKHGPVGTKAFAVLFTSFLLRELEGPLAKRSDIWLNRDEQRAYWKMPVSKTDSQALGCVRAWGCTCPTSSSITSSCRYHTALGHLQSFDERFSDWDPL